MQSGWCKGKQSLGHIAYSWLDDQFEGQGCMFPGCMATVKLLVPLEFPRGSKTLLDRVHTRWNLKTDWCIKLWWHCTRSSDCQVRVRGAPSNVYGVNVTKAVIGAYMWQWWLVQILWHLPCVFSSFCCLMNYYTVTFATCWYMGWVKILQLTFCVNLMVATVNFL